MIVEGEWNTWMTSSLNYEGWVGWGWGKSGGGGEERVSIICPIVFDLSLTCAILILFYLS